MTDYGDLHYPNLRAMKVKVAGSEGSANPPVRLSKDCFEVLHQAPPSKESSYDFSLERNVLQKLSEREVDHKLTYATTTSELKAAMVGQMKTVTGASEDRCIAILESKDYNLKASIETFYRS